MYINIIYLPFHTVQFTDYKQYTIVKYRRNVKIANNEAVSPGERFWKQAANALVALQPGTFLIRSLTTVTKWDVGDDTPAAFLHYWRGT